MKTYKTIYLFEVIDKVKEGKCVYVADRQEHKIDLANTMAIGDLTAIMVDENKSNRFIFWIEEDEDENK